MEIVVAIKLVGEIAEAVRSAPTLGLLLIFPIVALLDP
jgi:hypothetical protein